MCATWGKYHLGGIPRVRDRRMIGGLTFDFGAVRSFLLCRSGQQAGNTTWALVPSRPGKAVYRLPRQAPDGRDALLSLPPHRATCEKYGLVDQLSGFEAATRGSIHRDRAGVRHAGGNGEVSGGLF